jgi:hypothetical protein
MDKDQFRRFVMDVHKCGAYLIRPTGRHSYPWMGEGPNIIVDWRDCVHKLNQIITDPLEFEMRYGIEAVDDQDSWTVFAPSIGTTLPDYFPNNIWFRSMSTKQVEEMIDTLLIAHLDSKLAQGD